MFSRAVCFALLGCNRRKREKVLWTGVRIYSGNLNGLSNIDTCRYIVGNSFRAGWRAREFIF